MKITKEQYIKESKTKSDLQIAEEYNTTRHTLYYLKKYWGLEIRKYEMKNR